MGYHIFLAAENTFNISVERGVYGGIQSKGSSKSTQLNSEIISSFAGIEVGDSVFFYVKNKVFMDWWRVTTEPFYDTTSIWNNPKQFRYKLFRRIRWKSNMTKLSNYGTLCDTFGIDCRFDADTSGRARFSPKRNMDSWRSTSLDNG